jgi:large subunit ribosomal protein L9
MEVILKEDIIKLGHRGDVVVAALWLQIPHPQKLAIEATVGNKAVIEQMKAASVRKSAKEKDSAEALGQQLSAVVVEFTRKSGENDQLFGSVTSSDIAHALEAKGFNIDRRKISLDVPLKAVGTFDVPVKLHREVTVNVKAVVKKEAESSSTRTRDRGSSGRA